MREETDVVSCRECGADMVFLMNAATGRRVPVNADTVEPGDQYFESGKHVSHFTTCTNPNRFSRGKR